MTDLLTPTDLEQAERFREAFLAELKLNDCTADAVCSKYGIVRSNSIGAMVRSLSKKKLIQCVGTQNAVARSRRSSLTRIWRLAPKAVQA